MIDWTNPAAEVTSHFTVKDCLWLNKWNRLAGPNDRVTEDIQNALASLCGVLENVRQHLGFPMNVHSMYRSPEYSPLVGGGSADVHTQAIACDFDCNPNMTCDEVKAVLMPKLEELGIRMENNGAGAGWVHVDTHAVGHLRFFTP